MATERQIAANRRNAGKSTGPRSRAGKKRARSNAYRHGLTTAFVPNATLASQIEKLARKIAGNTRDEIVLELARDAAYAEIELARVRRVKVALIERAAALAALETPRLFNSAQEAIRFLNSVVQGKTPAMPNPVDCSATMPTEEVDRTAEAIRRALPELVKLDRYESRAAARRDKVVRQIIKSRISKKINL
jgi:hypothetical protein